MTRAQAIERAKILKLLIETAKITKILNTFIKAFENNSILKEDGYYYLHGNFNLGGTKSMRLSSSGPNLQNLPSGSTYGDLIKQCFVAPSGFILVGADFSSLEDKISALTTKDPNKIKVYTDGYDGHSLRAFNYYRKHMPDIKETVASINSIAKKYPELRQASKGSTFALTYGGSAYALVNQCGLTKEDALRIEKEYHKLYSISDEWVQEKLNQAASDGYVTLAFGGRLRTPILKQTILNKKNTPAVAAAEGRTAGNALGQSYGLLNNRSAIDFQKRVWDSEYANDIRPTCQIHDAQYFLVRDTIGAVKWVNDNLVETMQWQSLPELKHDQVHLGGELDIFHPNWSQHLTLPNAASMRTIWNMCAQFEVQPSADGRV